MAYRSHLKIRFGDIDRAGIVYYPRFLHYFHVALEEFFSDRLGIEYHHFIDTHRMGLPTVHLETDFNRPFMYGDDIEVEVKVLKVGRASITFGYRVFKKEDSEPRITGHNVTVCINMDKFEKIEIPEWFRQKLESQINH
ncbi:MAG: thioesterase family protein [Deltaproteobacteria bacterium]|jgi:4-hydroxybenzoyl-CoA thioesterase|nr:thioesterase family protein [Deltaproteobacteria bacterium]